MNMKMDFLIKAIEEVQETNRFLDTKAGVVVIFESSLLVFMISGFMDKSVLELVYSLKNNISIGYLIFLSIYVAAFFLALIIHILITLRVIFPQESPENHIDFSGFEPKRLFYLFKLSKNDVIQPSVLDYSEKLLEINEDEMLHELVFELMKLSYIRKKKNNRLAISLKFLGVLIVSLVVFGFLVGFGL